MTATELARNVGDILARVRYQGDSYVIERNGEVVALLVPLPERPPLTVGDLIRLWHSSGPTDPDFADDLEKVNSFDWPPDEPWPS